MSKQELENLARIGQIKAEPGTRAEFDGLVDSARKRLADARNARLSFESRFDLAYNAAHAFALAAIAPARLPLRKSLPGLPGAPAYAGRGYGHVANARQMP